MKHKHLILKIESKLATQLASQIIVTYENTVKLWYSHPKIYNQFFRNCTLVRKIQKRKS